MALDDRLHLVETIADGGFVAIEKPGYVKEGRRGDFAVHRVGADGETKVETAIHMDMLQEFSDALSADHSGGLAFACVAFRVFGGGEPPRTLAVAGTHRNGDYILKALKWIWAQEDLNHPIAEGKQGRKMAGYRLQEVLDGVPMNDVLRRADLKSVPTELQNVDYARVETALVGYEP